MKILIMGGDGYLGWPTAMKMAAIGHDVFVIDNYMRRNISRETSSESLVTNPNLQERSSIFKAQTGKEIHVTIGDCSDYLQLSCLFERIRPDAVIHYAEQPSAPYSMRGFQEARSTLNNNLNATFNIIWAVIQHAPDCHIIKLGTMGEYGTPNIDIEEGWIEIEHNGRKDKFLYPRQASSLYHTTKVLDTDLLWFYARAYGIRVTDLMQGPVYGIFTDEIIENESLLPNFHYDDIFGHVVNRFLVQAIAGIPLTVYGKGGQTRGYLNLKDTLQCVELALNSRVARGELRVLNQFTEQFSVNQVAEKIKHAARRVNLKVDINNIPNPRKEQEDHYYKAKHHGLIDLGLKPNYMTEDVICEMLKILLKYKQNINKEIILPRVGWN